MPKQILFIESGSIGADKGVNRFICRLTDKDASRPPEIVRLTITLFERPCVYKCVPVSVFVCVTKRQLDRHVQG